MHFSWLLSQVQPKRRIAPLWMMDKILSDSMMRLQCRSWLLSQAHLSKRITLLRMMGKIVKFSEAASLSASSSSSRPRG